jgi:hypothetical protein
VTDDVSNYLMDASSGSPSLTRAHDLLRDVLGYVRWLEEERDDLGERLSRFVHPEPAEYETSSDRVRR